MWTPIDPDRFNGTTVVEWAEVSDFGQFELTVELGYLSPMLEEAGYAFAVVSAEEGGVCDRTAEGVCTTTSLQGADPGRYASLDHPGDPYSFDIFSQALQAIKHPNGLAPLGGLSGDTIIATGFQPSIDKWFPDRRARSRVVHLSVQYLRTAERLSRQRGRRRRTARRRVPHRCRCTVDRADRVPGAGPAPSRRIRDPPDADREHDESRHLGGRRRIPRRPVVGCPHRDPVERRTDSETRTDRRAGGT